MNTLARVIMVYSALLITALAVSLAVFGTHATLIAFGAIDIASVLLITILSIGETGLCFRLEKPETAFSAESAQIALLQNLMKQSRGKRPVAILATLPPRP